MTLPPLRDANGDIQPPADIPPKDHDDSYDESHGGLACQFPGCTNAVVKPARGRTPKFCPEHKSNRGAKPTSGVTSRTANKLEAGLYSLFNSMALGTTGVALMTGNAAYLADANVIQANAEAMAKAWAEWAAVNPALRRWLEKAMQGSGAMAVVMATAPVAIGIAQNHVSPKSAPQTSGPLFGSGESRIPAA